MQDHHDWTTITPPQSANGWGQRIQMEIVLLRNELGWHKRVMRGMRAEAIREFDSVHRELSRIGAGSNSSGILDGIMDTIKTNWWKIAAALFFLGAAYGKTGKIPDPVAMIKTIVGL